MKQLRMFMVSGWLAYRGGFRILTPSMFIPAIILQPLAELLFFLKIGQYAGTQSAEFYVVGNAIYSCATGCLFSLAVAVTVDRRNGTLLMILASPASRPVLFFSRTIPAMTIGLTTGVVTMTAGWLLAGITVRASTVATLLVSMIAAALSACAFGLVIGTAGLRSRDINFAAGLALACILCLSGANIPISDLPVVLRQIAYAMPMTLSIDAARRAVSGQPGVWPLVLFQVVLVTVYLALATALLKFFEFAARRAARLDV